MAFNTPTTSVSRKCILTMMVETFGYFWKTERRESVQDLPYVPNIYLQDCERGPPRASFRIASHRIVKLHGYLILAILACLHAQSNLGQTRRTDARADVE